MINNFVVTLTLGASVLTLVAITLDRYRAILHPLRPKLSRLSVLCIIAAVWALSFALSVPNLAFSRCVLKLVRRGPSSRNGHRTEFLPLIRSRILTVGKTRAFCILDWSDGLPNVSVKNYM